jgi:hypothetical protein
MLTGYPVGNEIITERAAASQKMDLLRLFSSNTKQANSQKA